MEKETQCDPRDWDDSTRKHRKDRRNLPNADGGYITEREAKETWYRVCSRHEKRTGETSCDITVIDREGTKFFCVLRKKISETGKTWW